MNYTIEIEFTETDWIYAKVKQIKWRYGTTLQLGAHTFEKLMEHVFFRLNQHRILSALFGKITPHD